MQHPSLGAALTVASKQMKGFGGCFALELCSEAAAKALPAALKLFRSATSLGGVEPWWILERCGRVVNVVNVVSKQHAYFTGRYGCSDQGKTSPMMEVGMLEKMEPKLELHRTVGLLASP